jgi:acetyl-CoA carboxylase biotin carboxyl carrier protein
MRIEKMEFENLLTLIKTVSDSKLTDLKYEENGIKLHLIKKQGNVPVEAARPAPAAEVNLPIAVESEPEGRIMKSPLVGVFYAAPAEDAESFVSVGDVVKKGQTMAIIEAMKLMNEIECEFDGTLEEIYVTNGQPVEYGQPLFRIG